MLLLWPIHYFRCWHLAWLCVALLSAGAAQASVALPGETTPRVVKVGVYANAPKIFLGEDGQPSGILGDVLVAIAEREHWTLKPVRCEWQDCLDSLQSGGIDLMPDVAFTDQRGQIFDFHNTVALLSWSQIYKVRGEPISSMLDLTGKRVAVVTGSVQESSLRGMLQSFGVKAELVPVESFQAGFELTAAKLADAVATNRFYGDLQAPKYRLEPTAIVFQPAQLYYATQKGKNASLLQAIDRHLAQWQTQSDSPYAQALQRWLLAPQPLHVPVYLWWTLGGLVALLLLALLVTHWLRRQVALKTAHLIASENRLNTILDSVDACIYIKDTALRYQYANNSLCRLFEKPLAQVLGQTDQVFFDAATVAHLQANDRRVIEHGERVETEEANASVDGSHHNTFLSVKLPLRHPDGSIYALCGISTDISSRLQAEDAIHQLAFYDPLTGLPNRRLLQDRLQQLLSNLLRNPQGAALLFIDVDNFKDINDTQGHEAGDLLLCQMAQRIGYCIRTQDTLARQGGDEFVVMLAGLHTAAVEAADQALHIAQKLLVALRQPYALNGQPCQSSVSIGVALIDETTPNQEKTRDELFKQADLAMYQAKADGRNTLRFFSPTMQAQVLARTSLEADLQRALLAQEFVLHYQVQVDDAGLAQGYEALVRWQHPTRGLVPPGVFIATAEACGVILPLGRWILTRACQQLVVWAAEPAHAHWTIAVNVSAQQFRQTDFVDQVQAVLMDTQAKPSQLELELTESQLVDDVDGVIAKMTALKSLGVRLSLDDFGTGYSSLNMLKRLPLDQLKIDQSFVKDMLTDKQDASIIRAIITMGDSLSLEVIAEGVELPAQRDALQALGCHHFQGYLFGRPAPLAGDLAQIQP
jgi:diguanylate cyclase (GGDEF)-like protein/PAS domain S-box-containing protein